MSPYWTAPIRAKPIRSRVAIFLARKNGRKTAKAIISRVVARKEGLTPCMIFPIRPKEKAQINETVSRVSMSMYYNIKVAVFDGFD